MPGAETPPITAHAVMLKSPTDLATAMAAADMTGARLSRAVGCSEQLISQLLHTPGKRSAYGPAIEAALGLAPGTVFTGITSWTIDEAQPSTTAQPEPDFLKSDEVAARLRVGPHQVRKWRQRGELAATNVGTDRRPIWRFSEAEVLRFVRVRTSTQRGAA